jgi:hypothetical protein
MLAAISQLGCEQRPLLYQNAIGDDGPESARLGVQPKNSKARTIDAQKSGSD